MSLSINQILPIVLMGLLAYLQVAKNQGPSRVLRLRDGCRVIELRSDLVQQEQADGQWTDLVIDPKYYPLQRVGIVQQIEGAEVYLYLLKLEEHNYRPQRVKTPMDNTSANALQLPREFQAAERLQNFLDENTNQVLDFNYLQEQQTELQRIRVLVSSSEAYQTDFSLLDQAETPLNRQIINCDRLVSTSTGIIRDQLIGFAVAGFDVSFDDNQYLDRISQYQHQLQSYRQAGEVLQRKLQLVRNKQ